MLDTTTFVALISLSLRANSAQYMGNFLIWRVHPARSHEDKNRSRFGAALSYRLHPETNNSERYNREWANVGTSRPMHTKTADFKHPHKSFEVPRNIASSSTFLGPDGDSVSWEASE